MQYASLARLIEQANAWNAANKRKLTTFVKRLDAEGEYALSCGNMAWRGDVSAEGPDAQKRFEEWLGKQAAIEVVGVVTQAELFAD